MHSTAAATILLAPGCSGYSACPAIRPPSTATTRVRLPFGHPIGNHSVTIGRPTLPCAVPPLQFSL